jgi:hypothetical protein
MEDGALSKDMGGEIAEEEGSKAASVAVLINGAWGGNMLDKLRRWPCGP